MSNPIQNASQIQQGIDFIRAQTQPESITNEHVANVLEAMQKPRILRNLTDSVQTGQLQISPDFPAEYPENSVIFTIKSSNAPDEDVEIVKGSTQSITRWALGEPEYEAFVKNELLSTGLPFGWYYQIGASGGQILFGNNLGGVPAGTSLGKFTSSINLYLQKTNMGQELIKSNVNVKITQQVAEADFPVDFVTNAQYFSNENIVKDGNNHAFSFFNVWKYRYFYLFNKNAAPFVLTKTIKVETFKNGVSVYSNQYGVGATLYQNSWQWAGQAYNLQPDDNIEIVISEVV